MNCAEFKEAAAAWALGALPLEERRAFDEHLRSAGPHDGCAEAARAAQESVALIALSEPPLLPSSETWASIERRVASPARARAWWPGWAAAAAVAIVLLFVWRDRGDQFQTMAATAAQEKTARAQCVAELEKAHADAKLRDDAVALLQQPGTRLVPLAAQGQTTATANVVYATNRAFVVGHALAAAPGKDYELWLIRGDKKIPAGILRGDSLIAAIDPALLVGGAPDAVAVTLEAAGGRPQPEGPIVLVGKI